MRALELNLASRPFRNNVPIWSAFGFLAFCVLLSTAWNIRSWLGVSHKMRDLRADIGSSEKQLASLEKRDADAAAGIRAFDPKTLQAQVDKVNEIIERRGLSWTRLFNDLEKVVPYEVRMTTIHPSYGAAAGEAPAARARSFAQANPATPTIPIVVDGVAQSLDAFLELERSLIVDPHFAGVEPVRNETVGGSAEVKFELSFEYDPEGRLGQDHPDLPHVLEAARKAAEEGGEAPPSSLEGLR